MFADLRTWPTRRWMIATEVAGAAFFALVATAGFVSVSGGAGLSLWWAVATIVLGATLIGLIVSSYVGTPIGADATLCDTRWPLLGLIGLYLATEVRSLEPVLSGAVRPVVAAAALTLLIWALRERLTSEHRAATRRESSGAADGEVCATCRPLFPRPASASKEPLAPADVRRPI